LASTLPKLNQPNRFELAVPATFVVGKDQRIRFVHVEPDHRRRPLTLRRVTRDLAIGRSAAAGEALT
jgi:hypothetical protein